MTDPRARMPYEDFYIRTLTDYKLYTDVLVLNESSAFPGGSMVSHIMFSLRFIESIALPYVSIINLGEDKYRLATEILVEYNLKLSDSLHLGVMLSNDINLIISEDKEFDRVMEVKRLWI